MISVGIISARYGLSKVFGLTRYKQDYSCGVAAGVIKLLPTFGIKPIGGTMKRVLSGLCRALLVGALFSLTGWAQATAQINGTVRDQTGAVLPGVEVTATQAETG